MVSIVTRQTGASAKNAALTNAEMDANFIALAEAIEARITNTVSSLTPSSGTLTINGAVHSTGRPSAVHATAEDNNAAFTNTHALGYGLYSRGGSGGRYAAQFNDKDGNQLLLLSGTGVLTVAGGGAFGGTISSGATNVAFEHYKPASTTYQYIYVANTSGYSVFGTEGSSAALITGANPWDAVVRGKSGIAFSANDGITLHARLSSAGALTVAQGGTFGGNVGVGAAPNNWGSYSAVDIGGNGAIAASSATMTYTQIVNGAYYNGTNWIYKYTDVGAARYELSDSSGGVHRWFSAPSGTAGSAISFTQAMTLDVSGNLSVTGSMNASGPVFTAGGQVGLTNGASSDIPNQYNGNANQVLVWHNRYYSGGLKAGTANFSGSLEYDGTLGEWSIKGTSTTQTAGAALVNDATRLKLDRDGKLLLNTGSALSSGILSIQALSSTNGVVVKTGHNDNYTFAGQNTAGDTTFSVTGSGNLTVSNTVTAEVLRVGNGIASTVSPKHYISAQNADVQVALEVRQGRYDKDVVVATSNQTLSASFFKAIENGTDIFSVGSGGNLGLGVTPCGHLPMGYGGPMVQVGGRATILGSATTAAYCNNVYYASGYFRYISDDAATMLEQVAGEFRLHQAATGTAGQTISFVRSMTLDVSGNFLIGRTTNPKSARLAIEGDLAVHGGNTWLTPKYTGSSGIGASATWVTVVDLSTLLSGSGYFAARVRCYGYENGTNNTSYCEYYVLHASSGWSIAAIGTKQTIGTDYGNMSLRMSGSNLQVQNGAGAAGSGVYNISLDIFEIA